MQIGGELLVAEDRQSLLERQLEPVAAGHPVAGPVVEILVRDHALDAEIVAVRCGLRPGQHELGVEDVEALVFHGAEVEIGHRHDHEPVEVVLQAEALLVPAHRLLERGHGVGALVDGARLGIDLERDVAARARGEGVREPLEAAGDQGEQIAGLREGVLPNREVPAAGQAAVLDQVAVGEQNRAGRPVRLDPDAVPGHDIGPVGEIRDLAEALRLALGAEHAIRDVQALERGVALGADAHFALEGERGGQVVHRQALAFDLIAVPAQRLAIEPEVHQLQLLAVEHQRTDVLARRRVAPHHEARPDLGARRLQAKLQLDLVHQVVGRPVIRQTHRLRGFGLRLSFGRHGLPRNAGCAHLKRRQCGLPDRAGRDPTRTPGGRPRSLARRIPRVHHGSRVCRAAVMSPSGCSLSGPRSAACPRAAPEDSFHFMRKAQAPACAGSCSIASTSTYSAR
jgi:hypothetical protein